MSEKKTLSVPQGLRGRLWGPLLAATVPTACVPALVTRWVLVPLLQQRRACFDVCCRVRPLIASEMISRAVSCVTASARPNACACLEEAADGEPRGEPSRGELFTPGNVTVSAAAAGQTFDLDSVVTGTDQALPFAVVRPYVERFVDRAEPGAVVAYGQTSAGKTHTILGDAAEGMEGAAVRGVRLVLERLAATNGCHQSERRVLLVSMYEIYLEALRDLTPTPADIGAAPSDGTRAEVDAFVAQDRWAPPCHRAHAATVSSAPPTAAPEKMMRQCAKCREVFVHSSKPLYVDTEEAFVVALQIAQRRRTAAHAGMGPMRSQGHFVVSLGIAAIPTPSANIRSGDSCFSIARFDFVVCAGQERLSRTGATGAYLKQAVKINQSLSSLDKVVHAIATASRFVPFRDSVLTQLLQRSAFADTARTLFIVCVSPADRNADETISTLRFAQMAQGRDSAQPGEAHGIIL